MRVQKVAIKYANPGVLRAVFHGLFPDDGRPCDVHRPDADLLPALPETDSAGVVQGSVKG